MWLDWEPLFNRIGQVWGLPSLSNMSMSAVYFRDQNAKGSCVSYHISDRYHRDTSWLCDRNVGNLCEAKYIAKYFLFAKDQGIFRTSKLWFPLNSDNNWTSKFKRNIPVDWIFWSREMHVCYLIYTQASIPIYFKNSRNTGKTDFPHIVRGAVENIKILWLSVFWLRWKIFPIFREAWK